MRAFRAVVETRSFKRAGDQLGLGGSAVSKLIAGLERDVGAVLLQRTTRKLAITEAGEAFYDSVVRVLDETALAIDRLQEHDGQPQGVLRVSVPTSFALMWLSTRMPDFLVRYPGLRLDMTLNDRYVDLVAERYDCALRIGSELPDSALYARRLGWIPRVLVAAPGYLNGSPPLCTPADLAAHDALVYSLSNTGSAWTFMVEGEPVSVEVSGRFKVNNSIMLRDTLLAGIGLALTPHFVVQDLLASQRLMALLPDFVPGPLGVHGVITQRRHVPMKTQIFLDFVQDALERSGYGESARG
ncbi:MAG: LysR family transcriptional regulator [Luteimonas sp.]|nr:LysR family transcriptional regulator [Luteimonas sp.]